MLSVPEQAPLVRTQPPLTEQPSYPGGGLIITRSARSTWPRRRDTMVHAPTSSLPARPATTPNPVNSRQPSPPQRLSVPDGPRCSPADRSPDSPVIPARPQLDFHLPPTQEAALTLGAPSAGSTQPQGQPWKRLTGYLWPPGRARTRSRSTDGLRDHASEPSDTVAPTLEAHQPHPIARYPRAPATAAGRRGPSRFLPIWLIVPK